MHEYTYIHARNLINIYFKKKKKKKERKVRYHITKFLNSLQLQEDDNLPHTLSSREKHSKRKIHIKALVCKTGSGDWGGGGGIGITVNIAERQYVGASLSLARKTQEWTEEIACAAAKISKSNFFAITILSLHSICSESKKVL